MIRRAMVPRLTSVSASVLGVVAYAAAALAASLALAAPAAADCANESLRLESNTNPTTGQPYSEGLPDCRAYEMVSPLYKQGQDAKSLRTGGLPAAPGGETVAWASQGDFSNPENYTPVLFNNVFLSQRGASGWITSSAFAPRNLIDIPSSSGLEGDSAPDLRSVRAGCGQTPQSRGERGLSYTLVCARREGEASWMPTEGYPTVSHEPLGEGESTGYLGGSSDLSRLFIQPKAQLLLAAGEVEYAGIYEIAGCCTPSSTLRLVNVDNKGTELLLLHAGSQAGPLVGDTRPGGSSGPAIRGSRYHAISNSGGTVFFTATPNEPEEDAIQTVYARINCGSNAAHSSAPSCKKDGNGEWFETVAVSNPSPEECSQCNTKAKPQNATFQGASADGSKVFFTTKQQLLSVEKEGEQGVTPNLYEYINGPEGKKRLVLLSPDPAGAKVTGVVRTSPDGSHVYFVAMGVLTEEANGNDEKAEENAANLYGYDTVTKRTKFVAANRKGVQIVEGISGSESGTTVSSDSQRHAQTTPDGRYLVFSSKAQLEKTGDTNVKGCPKPPGECHQAVYRYDFETGALSWVSKPAPGFTPVNEGEGKPALVAPLPGTTFGAEANIDDWARAISENGEYVIFTTAEKLQADDVNNASDVYEWHHGTVAMISDGHDPGGVGEKEAVMSASGSDIFFLTRTQLVAQDTDGQRDLYDARVGGGFPRPNEGSCSGEACQGPPSAPPPFPSAASSLFAGGQNLTPPLISVAPSMNTKPLTRAQQLARALKACKGKPKRERPRCESQARKKYGPKAEKKAKSKSRRRHG